MANSRKNKTARPAFDAAAWVNENPTAAPSKGQIFAMFVLTVAAGEAAIGLAILVIYFRSRGTIAVDDVNRMKG